MTARRVLVAVVAAVTLALVAPLVLGATSAGAVTRATLTVGENRPASASFGTIPGNSPSSGVLIFFPDDCSSPDVEPPLAVGSGAGSGFCDNVPIQVIPPNVPETTPWFVDIEVAWADPAHANDIDVTLFDDQQITKREGSTGYTQMGAALTAENPERIKTYQPLLKQYNLVVLNYVGPNTGYTVKVTMTVGEPFQTPFELLEDEIATGDSGGDARSTGEIGISDLSGLDDLGFGFSSDLGGISELTPGVESGSGFDDLAASDISALPSAPLPPGAGNIAQALPGPASGVLMFIWLILVPAMLIGGAATYIVTRSRRGTTGFA